MQYIICDKVKELYLRWWNRDNEYPLISVHSRKTIPRLRTIPIPPRDVEKRWLDEKFLSRLYNFLGDNIYLGGVALPLCWPNLGPDIQGAVTGLCDLKFSKSTSWAEYKVNDWDSIDLRLDEDNIWWRKIQSMTQSAVDSARNNYFVGITDLHPGTDGLVSLRGPENLCYDLIDCPELVEKNLAKMHEVYIQVYKRLEEIIDCPKFGYSTWNYVWSDTRYNIVGSDFSCMISSYDYERFVAPHIEWELDFLDRSIYHLDGVDALRHLDRILAFKKLTGVQWVPGEGKPPMREWIPVLKRIQDAGKIIEISVEEEDIKPICDNLDPRGLMMRLFVYTKTKAKRLEDFVKTYKV